MMYRLKKMAYLLALGNGRCRRLPKPRVFRDRNQPMDVMDDDELIARYRMPRHMIAQICEMLDEDLRRISHRSQALPVSTQVMVAAVLHNMCINNAIPAPDQIPLDDEGLPEPAEVDVTDSKGASLRRQLIDKRFGQ